MPSQCSIVYEQREGWVGFTPKLPSVMSWVRMAETESSTTQGPHNKHIKLFGINAFVLSKNARASKYIRFI